MSASQAVEQRVGAGAVAHPVARLSAATIAAELGLPTPTAEQTAIIEAPLRPLLVVAGAGSGKTETMASRVLWLVANGLVSPGAVLGLTFTRKAAGELSARLRSRLSQLDARGLSQYVTRQQGEPTVSTYHAYALRVVAEHGVRAGYEPEISLLGEAGSWQIAEAVVAAYDGDMSAVMSALSTVTAQVHGLASQLAEQLRTPVELAEYAARLRTRVERLPTGKGKSADTRKLLELLKHLTQLIPLVEGYAERKQAAESADYGDQMARAARLAADHPEVGSSERDRFTVVLLDEYQDTSHAQLTLLQSTFDGGHPVIAVGDSCQAIYGWRGASAGNLARFPTDFPSANGIEADVAPLAISWRNASAVLSVANVLSSPLRSPRVPDLTANPHRPDIGQVRYALCETVNDEATWLARELAGLRSGGATPPTTALLLRTRSQLRRYVQALRREGLPVEVVGVGGLLEVAEVRDVVATIRVLCDPAAAPALMRLLTGARWRIGAKDLAALQARTRTLDALRRAATEFDAAQSHIADSVGIIDALDDLGPPHVYSSVGYTRLQALRDELRLLRSQLNQPLPDLVAAVESALGIGIEVAVRDTSDPAAARAQLDELAAVVSAFAEGARAATPSALLAYLDAASEQERGLTPGRIAVNPGAVQVLTIHAAKGLEWDVVAVAGLSEGKFPGTERTPGLWTRNPGMLPFDLRGDRDELPALRLADVTDQSEMAGALERLKNAWDEHRLAEERRLVYVAVTRARTTLLCSGYWWADSKTPCGPSTFLSELDRHERAAGRSPRLWAPVPTGDNPLLVEPRTVSWPVDPLGDRRAAVVAGAKLVTAAGGKLSTVEREAGAEWFAHARLLLAEREKQSRSSVVAVPLPSELSVSQLVGLQRDSAELAAQLHRPMPRPPAPTARRGTAFHAWLERRFTAQSLLDLDELPGSADTGAAPDAELPVLQQAFERSEWSHRTPAHVEVPFAMMLGDVQVRGRMDAVFASQRSEYREDAKVWEVIDWKTGVVPIGVAARAAAVQLAAYRLAWAQLAGVPLDQVRAGFHYVRVNRTERPVDLLDADRLAALITAIPEAQ